MTQAPVRRSRPKVARYRSGDIGSTWFAGAALSVIGGAVVGAVAGVIVGFLLNAGLTGPSLGLLVGAIVGLLLGVLAALTIAPALAWALHLPALQGSYLPKVVSAGRGLVTVLTVVGWTVLTLITSEGIGAAIGDVTYWWMLLVLLAFGWWATARVVMVSNVASRPMASAVR